MFKKIIVGFLILATSMAFGMSLAKINKASKSDLMAINGIGEVKAKAIMKARPFKSLKDVESVKGVGPQLLSNLKGDVKSTDAVKKVKKSTKRKVTSKSKSKKDIKEKAKKKTKSKSKKRKIKSMDDKKKELKTKAKKTKKKKTKAKKKKKTKSKKKN